MNYVSTEITHQHGTVYMVIVSTLNPSNMTKIILYSNLWSFRIPRGTEKCSRYRVLYKYGISAV